jgi:hypothetical protein
LIDQNIQIHNAESMISWLKRINPALKKTVNISVRVEVYRLLLQLKKEIRAGNPGGVRLKPLSVIASRTKKGLKRRNKAPLNRLAKLIRYNIKEGDEISAEFGFTDSVSKSLTQSWKRLVLEHAGGLNTVYAGGRTELGIRMARIGAKLKKAKDPDYKYFFLRKNSLSNIDLPVRELIENFWRTNEPAAMKNIEANFIRKLAGERI